MIRIAFHTPGCRKRGLTLGEMLVVLAVFCILAIMLFFSSNLAITKTKLAVAMNDQKLLTQALFTYEGEYAAVPDDTQGLDAVTHAGLKITQIPNDPFTPSGQPQEYGYYSDLSPSYRWIIVSVGPNGHSDIDQPLTLLRKQAEAAREAALRALLGSRRGGHGAAMRPSSINIPRQPLMSDKEAHDLIIENTYDPTNGVNSAGDVITVYGQ